MVQDFKSEIAAKAEAALSEGDEGKGDDAGTATGKEEKVDPTKPDDDSAAADEGDSSDESEEGEEDDEEAESEEETDSKDESDEEDSEDEEDSLDEDDEEDEGKAEKPMSRSQKRIKQLVREKKLSEDENAVLKAQLAIKDGTPAEKAAADKKLLDKGYTSEQIAEGKKFLESLGYMPPEKVSEMQKQLQRIEDDKLIAEDRAELRDALKKTKSEMTEKDVMKYVQKWATSKNPKIAARASLDYPAIIRLIAGKAVKKTEEGAKDKKKAAPKIPAGGGGSVTKKEESTDDRWDPGDRRGSMERLLAKASAHLDDE